MNNPYLTLLLTSAEESEWRKQAACIDDPEKWFAEGLAGAPERQEAKTICRKVCPVKDECLATALANPSTNFGIWGGEDFSERGTVARRLKTKTIRDLKAEAVERRHLELMRLYRKQLNDREIGEASGVDRTAVHAWRKRHNLPVNKRRRSA